MEHNGGDELERLRRLRALHADGIRFIFGISSGDGGTVPDLKALGLDGVEVLDPVTALEQVAPGDQALAVAGVARAMESGATADELHMADGTWATTHLFDLTVTHGMVVGAVVGSDRLDGLRLADRAEVPPRVGHLTMDGQGRVLWANHNIRRLFGYDLTGDGDRHVVSSLHPEDRPRNLAVWAAMLASPGEPHRTRYRRRHAEGHWIWCEATFINHLHDAGDPRVDVEIVDISSEMAAHDAVRDRERLLQRLAESLPDGVLQLDAHRTVVYANSRAHDLLGPEATLTALVDLTVTDDRPALTAAIDAALGTGDDREVEVRARPERPGAAIRPERPGAAIRPERPGAAIRPERPAAAGPAGGPCEAAVYRVTLRAVAGDDHAGGDDGVHAISGALCCIADVTEQVLARRELESRATHDDLTAAYNRVATLQVLEAALAEAGPDAGVAVVFVDLDDFKRVNDTYGHTVGDRLLRAVAARLLGAVRADDVVGRFGGDEFLVVCPRLSAPAAATDVVRRIERALERPEAVAGVTVVPTASIGVAWTFSRGGSAEQLIAEADASMYASKRAQA